MKRLFAVLLCALLLPLAVWGEGTGEAGASPAPAAESAEAPEGALPERVFPYRFADREEAVRLYLSNEAYFEGISAADIQYRTQNRDGTTEDLKAFGAEQMQAFSESEKELLSAAMDEIETIIRENGYVLPRVGEIVFIKSTQREEGAPNAYAASAYTHGTQIYMNNYIPLLLSTGPKNHKKGLSVICHELFHCLTRSNPEFRRDMYGILGFQIADRDFDIPEDLQRSMIANPDVEHHDAYASFIIGGEKKDCYLMLVYARPFEEAGDGLASSMQIILVPTDGDAGGKAYYGIDEAENFWEVFGRNTEYVTDPEECLADNFRFALAYGMDRTMMYKDPEIILRMLDRIG